MKNIIPKIIIALGSYVLGLFLPSISIIIFPIIVGLVLTQHSPTRHFFIGFSGIFLYWGIMALFAMNSHAQDLAPMIGDLFSGITGIGLVVITAIIGGLYGGIASWSGRLISKYILNRK